jgi:hypothetical protein
MRYALLLLLAVSFNASALVGTGNELIDQARAYLRYVENPKSPDVDLAGSAYWQGLVTGLAEGYGDHSYIGAVCYPEGATAGQLSEMAARYLVDHPEERTKNASILVYSSHVLGFGSMMSPACPQHEMWKKTHIGQ